MFRKQVLFISVIALVAVGGAAIVLSSNAEPVRIAAADAGTQVTLRIGQTLEVALEGNPTTGFGWEAVATGDSKIIRLEGGPEYVAESALIGAGGMFTFEFKAIGAGTADLELVYRRSWETDVAPESSFIVQVVVEQ